MSNHSLLFFLKIKKVRHQSRVPIGIPHINSLPGASAPATRQYVSHLLWKPRITLTGFQLERGTDGSAMLTLDGVTSEQVVQLTVPVGSTAGALA